jgi:hypothetical protein
MKWGSKYGPEYVNRLRGMVLRHTSKPIQLICLTDDANGIHPDIQCRPIPSLDLPSHLPERGWKKLTVFAPSLKDLKGTALFLGRGYREFTGAILRASWGFRHYS